MRALSVRRLRECNKRSISPVSGLGLITHTTEPCLALFHVPMGRVTELQPSRETPTEEHLPVSCKLQRKAWSYCFEEKSGWWEVIMTGPHLRGSVERVCGYNARRSLL